MLKSSTMSRGREAPARAASFTPARMAVARPRASDHGPVAGFDFAKIAVNGPMLQRKLAIGDARDPSEDEADRVAERVMRMPSSRVPVATSTERSVARKCAECDKEDDTKIRRKAEGGLAAAAAPPIVHEVLASPGRPLDAATRGFMEPRFGHDFSNVRVHTDQKAAQSARAVDARAYTVGRDVVFAENQYAPGSPGGAELLAHELVHTVQQEGSSSRSLRRTPARQVSCSRSLPLRVPGAPPLEIADPVAVITAAENRANAVLDEAIATLNDGRRQVIAGAPAAFPTIGDQTALGVSLVGINPDREAAWRGNGIGSVGLLIRRLSAIRRSIGSGAFFFTCIGPAAGAIPALPGSADPGCAGAICSGANAVSCPGTFRIFLCEPFWRNTPEAQAETLLHESAHNFAAFIQDSGREGNAGCYSRCAQVIAGVDPAFQRADLCPDP